MKKTLLLPILFAISTLAAGDGTRQWPLSLEGVANRGFRDEIAGDGKGGWTDQGPDVDLRDLREERITCGPVTFELATEEKHPGATLLALSGPIRGGSDQELAIDLPPNEGRGLYLLHAAAWPPKDLLGEVTAIYADGSETSITISTQKHCKDWRGVSSNLENGRVAWQGPGYENPVLFASAFDLKRSGPVKLIFRLRAPEAIWLIPAVTLTEAYKPFPPLTPFVTRPGNRYLPYSYTWGTKKRSALDFSYFNDAPAGKYGFVKVSDAGHFTFEKAPEKQIRFFGQNIVYDCNFPTRQDAVRIADELARTGCNLVRFHLNDDLMLKENARSSLDMDPAKLDAMEYFFAQLKERGIYCSIDLYGCRRFRPEDGTELAAENQPMAMKWVYPLNDRARENLKEFVRRWLCHVNPYTGLAWKDDPALAFLNLINEDVLETLWNRTEKSRRLFEEAFRKTLPAGTDFQEAVRTGFKTFLVKLQQKRLEELLDFARNELRLKIPISSLNMMDDPYLTLMRRPFDFVDMHMYFDHPNYSLNYRLPWSFSQTSAISRYAFLPMNWAPARMFGRPFVLTEYNYCHPNRYRAEGGPLLGAYSCLQDWDGLVCYRWACDFGPAEIQGGFRIGCFSGNSDPLLADTNRIIAFLFRTGAVKPAPEKVVFPIPDSLEAAFCTTTEQRQKKLGLFVRTGRVVGEAPASAESAVAATTPVGEKYAQFEKSGIAVSSTGELTLDSNRKVFRITTPTALSLTLPEGSECSGELSVSNADSFQTVTLLALDNRPIRESRNLLLFQLSDIQNSGAEFADASQTCLLKHGTTPLLLRRAICDVRLATGTSYQVNALATDGSVKGSVEGSFKDGAFSFHADNFRFGGVTAYQLNRMGTDPTQDSNALSTQGKKHD